MQLLLPEGGLLFWMLISFSVVFFILKRYAFPYILRQEKRRNEFLEQSIRNAQEANDRLETIHAQADEMIRDAQRQRKELLLQSKEECKELIQKAKENAERISQERMEELKVLLEEERKKALHAMQGEITAYAVTIAEQLLRQQLANRQEQMDLAERILQKQTFVSWNGGDKPKAS